MQGGGPRYPYSTREWVGPAGLDSQIGGRASSERLPSASQGQRQKRRRRRPPARAARPRHCSPFPCGSHHHHHPPGAHCRTHHSRGGVRYLSAPFAKTVVHSLILGVLASPSAQHYHPSTSISTSTSTSTTNRSSNHNSNNFHSNHNNSNNIRRRSTTTHRMRDQIRRPRRP